MRLKDVQTVSLRIPGRLIGSSRYNSSTELSVPDLDLYLPTFVLRSKTGAELLFEFFSQRYERGATLVTSNLPFDEWTEVFDSQHLTGTLLDRLTHHVNILEMNGESFRLKQSRKSSQPQATD